MFVCYITVVVMVIKNFNLRVNSSNYYTQNSKYPFSVYAYLFSHPITVCISNLSLFIINLCVYTSCYTYSIIVLFLEILKFNLSEQANTTRVMIYLTFIRMSNDKLQSEYYIIIRKQIHLYYRYLTIQFIFLRVYLFTKVRGELRRASIP